MIAREPRFTELEEKRAHSQRARRFLWVAVVDRVARSVAVLTLAAGVIYVVGFTLWTIWISSERRCVRSSAPTAKTLFIPTYEIGIVDNPDSPHFRNNR